MVSIFSSSSAAAAKNCQCIAYLCSIGKPCWPAKEGVDIVDVILCRALCMTEGSGKIYS